jgi:hypothetical protein
LNCQNRQKQGLFRQPVLGVSAPVRADSEPDRPADVRKVAAGAAPRPISASRQRTNGVVSAYVCVGLGDPGLSRGPWGAAGGPHNPAGGPQGLDGGPCETPRASCAAAGGPCGLAGGRRGAAVLAAMTDFMRRNRGKRGGCRANGAPAAPESAPLAARSGRFQGESGHGSYPGTA